MKITLLSLFIILFSISALAGDTTTIRIHDHTDMTWYGNYDEWGVLPDATLDYRKVYLHYTMGCATGGCSDWDYTSQIFVRHRTGEIDSTLQNSPMFTVNGNIVDSVLFSDTAYVHFWNTTTNVLDSNLSTLLEIIEFNDATQPTTPTDTMYRFQAGFYNMEFDSLGNIIDSFYVIPSNTVWINYHNWYQVYDVIENYELARVITPYGSGLANNWEFTHVFDVTDFIQILRDSVEIRCHYSGWSSGFSATLDFEFIEGTPPRDVVKFENIYSGNYNYSSSNDFEANKLTSQTKFIEVNSSQAMVKMTTTGHGFDNSQVAAEFKPINYYVNIDGSLTHTQYNWDADCGENPIYPQGGTWIYDRANWCPGKRAQAFDHEITPHITSGDSIEINVDFQSYSWSGTQTPSYTIECQLFQYEAANFSNSAEIINIIKPSLKDENSRKNPICGKPLITIRNYGSMPLTSLDIEYQVVGGTTNTYNWTGNLAFLETEDVELPNLNSWAGSDNIFEVTLKNPNGQADDYIANNTMQSEFEYVPEYPETFALWLGTNGGVINTFTQESETTWDFYNENGNIEFTSGSLYSNTQYRDTLTFTPGCYTFVVNDTDEDGLDFWANNDGGGMVRFREIGASWLKYFNADFGTGIVHQFTIGYAQTTTSVGQENNWDIYPNPTNNSITIEGVSDEETQLTLQDNLGKIILERKISNSGFISEIINLEQFENGIYFIKISNSKEKIIKKVVKQ
jgi:hypothetical protein